MGDFDRATAVHDEGDGQAAACSQMKHNGSNTVAKYLQSFNVMCI
jgi:hypothetical protein